MPIGNPVTGQQKWRLPHLHNLTFNIRNFANVYCYKKKTPWQFVCEIHPQYGGKYDISKICWVVSSKKLIQNFWHVIYYAMKRAV